jgi:hypothetical protein
MSRGMAELTVVDVEALVRRARTGDHDALGELYDRFRDRVARFATGRLGDASCGWTRRPPGCRGDGERGGGGSSGPG